MSLTPGMLQGYCKPVSNRTIYEALGEAVLVRRKRLGLTQAQVADKIGVSRESIANIEAGRQRVLLHHVYALARALGLKSITEIVPATLPREPGEACIDVAVSGDPVSETQRTDIDRLLSLALTEQTAGSTS